MEREGEVRKEKEIYTLYTIHYIAIRRNKDERN